MSQSSKLVIFRFGQGSFEQGFPVTMEISTEQNAPLTTLSASLPAMPELADCYNQWLASYRNLETTYRLTPKPNQITHGSVLKDCEAISQQLGACLNRWLQSDSIRSIREKLIQRIDQDDDIRLLFQTDQIELQRLPWHLWELLSRYSNAEVAVLPQSHDDIPLSPPRSKIRILAVFGEDSGINVSQDRAILAEKFPDAAITPLDKPTRRDLTEALWNREGWDIFFFAGHSAEREVGIFQINENESINIKMLEKTLPRAVKNGLRLVIFNSCNGLRLANDLASSRVPQIIVMRESVPDYVAQTFLSNFLRGALQTRGDGR
jgi:CHAT domain